MTTSPHEVIEDDLYNYPQYYDLVYGSDWKAEFDFLRACFDAYARRDVRRVFEPACGTGRLMVKLAQAGYEVAGNDLNERAVDYCNRRLERHGFSPTAVVGDMSDFTVKKPFDAAFNMINSFRHLGTEAAARGHLRCMARALSPGGIYVLGLHLTPIVGDAQEKESWSARRGHLAVISSLWTIDRDLDRREERVGMAYDVYTPTRQFRLEGKSVFRTYTAQQFVELIWQEPLLEIAAIHDFSYDIDDAVELEPDVEDAVFVLRRRTVE